MFFTRKSYESSSTILTIAMYMRTANGVHTELQTDRQSQLYRSVAP